MEPNEPHAHDPAYVLPSQSSSTPQPTEWNSANSNTPGFGGAGNVPPLVFPMQLGFDQTMSTTEHMHAQSVGQALYESQTPLAPSQMSSAQFETAFPIPEEFTRISSGQSVVEPNSVHDVDSGRSYHGYKEGKYLLPNDAAEQERLDVQHKCFTLALDGKLRFAPRRKFPAAPEYVMDVATGTGAIEYAERYPDSYVIGSDLSAIQPSAKRGLQNVEFVKDDSEEDWLYPQVPCFDYVHLRCVCTCFDDPKKVLRHAFNSLSPGGWVEYHDAVMDIQSFDGSHRGSAVEKIFHLIRLGLSMKGRELFAAREYKDWLREVGFVDIVEQTFMTPGNGWPDDPKLKRVGEFALLDLYGGIRGAAWKMLSAAGLSPMEIENLVLEYKRDAANENISVFWPLYVVYGRKPFEGEVAGGTA